MPPCLQTTDEKYRHAFEDLAKRSLIYCMYKPGERRIGRPRCLGAIIVDGYEVKLVTVAE